MILSHRDFILHLPESFSPSKSSPNLTSVEALKWKMNLLSTLIVPTVSSTLASSPPQTFLKCRCPQGQTQDSGSIIRGSTRMGKTGSRQGMGRQSQGHGSHQQLQCASRKLHSASSFSDSTNNPAPAFQTSCIEASAVPCFLQRALGLIPLPRLSTMLCRCCLSWH